MNEAIPRSRPLGGLAADLSADQAAELGTTAAPARQVQAGLGRPPRLR